METTLHQQLKAHYAGPDGEVEARVGRYRIDAVRGGRLIEVQHAGLAGIRDKVRALCESHDVTVVKPLVASKRLIKRDRPGGRVTSSRMSPKRAEVLDLFHELVHFTRAFPHPRLVIQAPLVVVEEHRVPGHGRRRRWRQGDFTIEDQVLVSLEEGPTLRTAADLLALIPGPLPRPFDTAELALAAGVDRWFAQRIAYCLRHCGAVVQAGKRGGAWLYEAPRGARRGPRRRPAA